MTADFSFGDYIAAKQAYSAGNGQPSWEKNEIALVFSRNKRAQPANSHCKTYDLLFENGRTAFTVDAETVHRHFFVLYRDPDVVIDGCSTNHGWSLARKELEQTR